MKKKQQQKLNDIIDNKDDESIKALAIAHVSSKQHALYFDLEKWKNIKPYLGLDQSMIDSVIARFEKQIDIQDYIYNSLI